MARPFATRKWLIGVFKYDAKAASALILRVDIDYGAPLQLHDPEGSLDPVAGEAAGECGEVEEVEGITGARREAIEERHFRPAVE
jgi:hypothetical protein